MNNLKQILQQAQKMQGQFQQIQAELENKKVEASAGGGMVHAVVNGRQELLELRIDTEVVDPKDVEMLEELVCAAVNKALENSREMMGREMRKLTGDVQLPGIFNNLFTG